jgi:hypothetical protein
MSAHGSRESGGAPAISVGRRWLGHVSSCTDLFRIAAPSRQARQSLSVGDMLPCCMLELSAMTTCRCSHLLRRDFVHVKRGLSNLLAGRTRLYLPSGAFPFLVLCRELATASAERLQPPSSCHMPNMLMAETRSMSIVMNRTAELVGACSIYFCFYCIYPLVLLLFSLSISIPISLASTPAHAHHLPMLISTVGIDTSLYLDCYWIHCLAWPS